MPRDAVAAGFVSEGDQIIISTPPGGGGGDKLLAFDKATGGRLGKRRLDAGSTGTLMTHLYRGAKYVVVAIGASSTRQNSWRRVCP